MANKSNEEFNQRFGRLLQLARKKKSISQDEMAEKIGMSKGHISAVERGVCKASVELLMLYCEVLKITPNDVFSIKADGIIIELRQLLESFNEQEQGKIVDVVRAIKDINEIDNKTS